MTSGRQLFTFLGDDFTGSTDVLLQYLRAGTPAILFLTMPDDAELAEAAERFQVIGIATVTRSLPVDRIEPVVREGFERLARIDPAVVQYKICSTVDSSSNIGSFAPAVANGRELFGAHAVPILAAQPGMGRYTAFANHFAADREGIHRLDRLDAMARHAITPMQEADLRRHIGEQIDAPIANLDVLALANRDRAAARLDAIREADYTAFVVDGLFEHDIRCAADVLLRDRPRPAFMIGSGGLSAGLAATLDTPADNAGPPTIEAATTTLAVAGSASQHTSDQIDAASAAGWLALFLDPATLESTGEREAAIADISGRALAGFGTAPGVIVYTAHRRRGLARRAVDVAAVGEALAGVVRNCCERHGLDRLIIAGGDTSGHVLTSLGARMLTATARITADLAMCHINATDDAVDGLEVVLKGGQLGPLDLFENVRKGLEGVYKNNV